MGTNEEESFSHQMRRATREAHAISDALVNTKMALALIDNKVWADGLLIFYEIFAFLERKVPPEILPEVYYRKEAFEKDLEHYLGSDWKENYAPRRAVQDYLDHLEELKKENPLFLIAYVYHLYMGVMSGAQILRRKRAIAQRMNPLSSEMTGTLGYEVTEFENHSVTELKKKMRTILDEKAKEFDEETKKRLLEESVKVFHMNNKIISTVQGVNQVVFKKIIVGVVLCILTYLMFKSFFP